MMEYRRFGPTFDQMLQEYKVDAGRLEQDFNSLVTALAGYDLIEIDADVDDANQA